jgi:hypothetical protein
MLLRDLKQTMLLPEKEIFINKIVKIRGIDVHLISITQEAHRNVLWVLYQLPDNFYEGISYTERIEYSSNREEMAHNVNEKRAENYFYIAELTIQKQKMTFTSSSGSGFYRVNYEGYMQLQHFIEKGMDTTSWEDVNLSNVVIASYEQNEDEEFPEIDSSEELDIAIKINSEFKQVLVNQSIKVEFGEMEKGKKIYFYNPIEKKHQFFYIDRLYHYDIWQDAKEKFESERFKALPKEQLKELKEQHLAYLEKNCPKGMSLVMLEYETEDGMQLDFYSKEYLDEKPAPKSSTGTVMFFTSDKKFGLNGFKSRVCMIKPVEKDFDGRIDVVLFSCYMEIPEENIKV